MIKPVKFAKAPQVNYAIGKLSSMLISDIMNMSMFPLTLIDYFSMCFSKNASLISLVFYWFAVFFLISLAKFVLPQKLDKTYPVNHDCLLCLSNTILFHTL